MAPCRGAESGPIAATFSFRRLHVDPGTARGGNRRVASRSRVRSDFTGSPRDVWHDSPPGPPVRRIDRAVPEGVGTRFDLSQCDVVYGSFARATRRTGRGNHRVEESSPSFWRGTLPGTSRPGLRLGRRAGQGATDSRQAEGDVPADLHIAVRPRRRSFGAG